MEDQGIQEILNKKGLDTKSVSVTIQQVKDKDLVLLYSTLSIDPFHRPLVRSLENSIIGITGRAVLQGKTHVVNNVDQDPDYIVLSPETRSEMAIPISFDGAVEAVVSFESPIPEYFDPLESKFTELAELAEELAKYLHLSIKKKQIETLLREPSFIDHSSTGLIHATIEEVSLSLIRELARNPGWLHNLTPRKFEELIARLLSDTGYLVKLTPPQKDGGRDIIASIDLPTGRILTIVECKKWSPNHPVPVSVIRGVYGVLISEQANQAMIATTSRFTSPAQQFVNSTKYQMSLKDYDDIADWLRFYL